MKRLLVLALLAGMALAQQSKTVPTPSQASPSPSRELTVAAIFAEGGITGRGPETVKWSPDGTKVSFVQRDDSGERGELRYVDVATSKTAVLVSAEKLATLEPGDTRLGEREQERRSRYSVAGYHWAPDSKHILFDSRGQLWLYTLATGTAVQITSSSDPVGDPKFSPDGSHISYVRKHNLYIRSADGTHERPLTRDQDENLLNGEVDWLYAEELDVRSNYFWSPDSKQILFLQMNETPVPSYPITDFIPIHPTVDMQKYPKAGDPNPVVRLGVVQVGGKLIWLTLPPQRSVPDLQGTRAREAQDLYIPRFGWVRTGVAWVQVLNRAQNQLDLYFVEVASGRSQLVLSEQSRAWVEVHDAFMVLKSGDRFLWSSWRDGHTHLYLYSFDKENPLPTEARMERQLTQGNFEVFPVDAVDEDAGLVYFTANQGDARQRNLYRVKLDGSGLERVSREDGTHLTSFSGNARYYVDTFSALMTPPRLSLCRVGGECQKFWEARSVAEYNLLPPMFVDFRADDGTVLHGLLLMPPTATADAKVPLLLSPYGGPGQQSVRSVWGGSTFLFHQLLAREGIAVLQVDNRGMAGRGREFAAVLRRNFGEVEIKDQLTALKQVLAVNPSLDKDRVGIWGWSYGATMTLWALTRSQAFKAGVAVAPVTEWRDYDSIYTERYLGLPRENPEGYKRSSPITTADGLHGSLLLVHGTGDDNVHLQNTIQMTQAFINAGKQFELMLYPRKTHGIAGSTARIDLFTRIQKHLERELLGRR